MTDEAANGAPEAPARSIEAFRGDYESLADMIQASWQDNDQALLYTPEFLRSALEYPGAGPALAPTLYEGVTPMGFVAGFPRHVRLGGRLLILAVSSFLSVTPRYKRVGMGGVLLGKLVERARAAGCDGMIQYCIEGGPMHGIVLGLARSLKMPTTHIYSIKYMSRMLLPKKAEPQEAEAQPVDARHLVDLAQALPTDQLARVWTLEEAAWQIDGRTGAVAAELEAEGRRGLITGYVMQVADGSRPRCLFVDDILWGDLEAPERQDLVKRLLAKASMLGARLAVVPQLGYADLAPFAGNGFRESQRVVHAYLSLWNGDPLPEEDVRSLYIDVF